MEIEGVLDVIVFRNEENGYTVGRFLTEDTDITIVGNALMIQEKEHLRLEGDLIFHPKYGEQFQFHKLETIRPQEKDAIIGYLSSGLIPNVGKKTAKRIVEHFGEETLEILEKSPNRLYEVEGVGKKRIESIIDAFAGQRDVRAFMLYAQELDLSPNLSIKIYKQYGENAESVIKENPYRLADEVRGIGFSRADKIAFKLGFNKDSKFRILSGMKHALGLAILEGHTYLPVKDLLEASNELLDIEIDKLQEYIVDLSIDPTIYLSHTNLDGRCYPARFYQAENVVATKLLQKVKKKAPSQYGQEILKELDEFLTHPLAEKQKEAVISSMKSGVLVITGGPGTGKTTTLKAIVYCMENMGLKVSLAAPTGRAAKRMEEATKRPAQTIHRLLQFEYVDDEFSENSRSVEDAIETDVVIVDEASMMDLMLIKDLLLAIEEETRLILVGDIDQLPSVGAGNVLRDIIASKLIPVVNLDQIFRQEETSMIIENAHRINQGTYPILNKRGGDFFYIFSNSQPQISDIIGDLVTRRLPDFYDLDPIEDIQVLSPMKKGLCGVESLNINLQKRLNPKNNRQELVWNGYPYRVADKVMQIKNDYQIKWQGQSEIYEPEGQGIFNGDIGRVTEIDEEEMTLKVIYDDYREVEYTRENLDLITPAYATTIHKSQGSEFPIVVIPLVPGPPMLLNRNLIYTAITRAKQIVVLVGEEKILHRMVDNNHILLRYSALDEMMKRQGELYETIG